MLPAGSTIVAGGYGQEKCDSTHRNWWVSPRWRAAAFIDRQRPEYVVTYFPAVFEHEVAASDVILWRATNWFTGSSAIPRKMAMCRMPSSGNSLPLSYGIKT